jgi:hypothetical protein
MAHGEHISVQKSPTFYRTRRFTRYGNSLRAEWPGDRIPAGFRPDRPWGPPTLQGTGSFPGVKQPECNVDRPPNLAPRLKKEYSYTSTPPLGLHGRIQSELYLLPKIHYRVHKTLPLAHILSQLKPLHALLTVHI